MAVCLPKPSVHASPGEKLRYYRQIKQISQEEISRILGCKNIWYITNLEKGFNPIYYEDAVKLAGVLDIDPDDCALPGFVDSKNEEKTERNAGYLVVSHSGGGMLRQGTRKGIRRTPANRGMRAHWVVKGLDISEDVCHGMCP